MLDIRKIRSFVAVYESGSITKAAEREHIAQPAITVHVQQIESEFNAKLFERSAHGVSPTLAGDTCYRLCIDLLRRLDAMGEQMEQFSGEVAGVISAGIMPSICHGPLAPMLTRYTNTYPNVDVRVVEGLSGTLAEWVLSDAVDFAICNRPASTHGLAQLPHPPPRERIFGCCCARATRDLLSAWTDQTVADGCDFAR